jgi:hypothetical protein
MNNVEIPSFGQAIAAVAEALKDKVGRKQIIALATLGCLTYLISQGVTDLKPLALVAAVGIAGIVAQLVLDWKRPRNGNGNLKGDTK